MSSVHEARYGDERLDIARAGRVGAAARAQVVHERLHRLAQALRTEDTTKAGRDVLLTLEPAEQAQGVAQQTHTAQQSYTQCNTQCYTLLLV